ncbi:MAG TPA: pyrroline-5-carboxylate reductase [Thermoleophilaceae bacterium]|nr:pyrroline-5-carboxylate reductase [Thermoleophilaceae bacterium]
MKLGFIGAGSMASALARGLGEPVLVYDPEAQRAERLAADVKGQVAASNSDLADAADVIVLCHKPAGLEQVATEVDGRARAVVSIMAATPTETLEAAYPGVPVYRFIPNLPAEVRRGVLCYAPGSLAADGPEQEILTLFGRAGTVIPLDEPLMEPAMALMSSGPAFLALVAEAMAEAGARHGLDPHQATRLVVETMAGTAAYLDANGLEPGEMRARVATPGGVTEKGLGVLEESGLRGSFDRAIDLIVEAAAR